MLLVTEGLGKRYERRDVCVDALMDVDLQVEERSFVTVTGPSGSGKTTLLLTLPLLAFAPPTTPPTTPPATPDAPSEPSTTATLEQLAESVPPRHLEAVRAREAMRGRSILPL